MLETAFKIFSIRRILSQYDVGTEIMRDELIIIGEDFPHPYTDAEMVRMIEETCILIPGDEEIYEISEELLISNLAKGEIQDYDLTLSIGEYKDCLDALSSDRRTSDIEVVRIKDCIDALKKSQSWASEIISHCEKGKMKAMSVFWVCQEDGSHTAMDILPATLATIDSAFLLCEPLRYGFTPLFELDYDSSLLGNFINLILSFQITQSSHDYGGFFIENDNDFPGVEYPTVEASSNAIVILSLLFGNNQLREISRISNAINSGIEFLLNMQLPNGGWGVYRYENDLYKIPARGHPCMRVMDAFSTAVYSGALKDNLKSRIKDSVSRYLDFLHNHHKHINNRTNNFVFWNPDFSKFKGELLGCVYETTWVIQGLTYILSRWPEFTKKTDDILKNGIDFILSEWKPNPESLSKLEFRVPTKQGPSGNFLSWEPPGDAVIITALLEYAINTGEDIKTEDWKNISKSISMILDSQHAHGHWNDPLLAPPKAFPSNTRWFSRAILSYLKYQKKQFDCIIM